MENTIKITTPIEKKEVELKAFLTGGEKMILSDTEGKTNVEITNVMIKSVVISVSGIKENVPDLVKGLHGKDFDFVLQEITKVIEDSSLAEKKN
jgi:hypothetical protein